MYAFAQTPVFSAVGCFVRDELCPDLARGAPAHVAFCFFPMRSRFVHRIPFVSLECSQVQPSWLYGGGGFFQASACNEWQAGIGMAEDGQKEGAGARDKGRRGTRRRRDADMVAAEPPPRQGGAGGRASLP